MADLRTIIAIDQGTTSSRAILFDESGAILAQQSEEFPQIFPGDGWVEHDPEAIWQTTMKVTRAMVPSAVQDRLPIAIGITNQRNGCHWDRGTGKAIHNAIVWQDRRTANVCAVMKNAGYEQMVTAKTGLLLDPYFTSTKLAWILDHVDGARDRAAAGELCFGTVDSFLIWRLTGGRMHVTDASNASRTNLYNIHENDWDDDLLDLFDVPRNGLPTVMDCAAEFGNCDEKLFDAALDPRRCRRPAGSGHRPGMFQLRRAEINLWHGLLCHHQHRRGRHCLKEPPSDNHRVPAERQDDLCT